MSYTINPNAKNKWARNAENTMDLSLETDASSVYLDNGRTLEQEIGEGSMVSSVATIDSAMSKIIDGTLDGAYESLIFKGRTLVNCVPNYTFVRSRAAGSNDYRVVVDFNFSLTKNKKYLVRANVVKNTFTNGQTELYFDSQESNQHGILDYSQKTGIVFNVVTVNIDGVYRLSNKIVNHTVDGEVEITDFMVIEYQQGMENWDIPYFTGLCDVKMPILRNLSSEAFCHDSLEAGTITGSGGVDATASNNRARTKGKKRLNGATSVLFSDNLLGVEKYLFSYDSNGKYLGRTPDNWETGNEIKPVDGAHYYRVVFTKYLEELPHSMYVIPKNHKTNILHTPETVTLRSLPNGVRDELNLKTGEYIKRIGEVVLDGSEKWNRDGSSTKPTDLERFSTPIRDMVSSPYNTGNFVVGTSGYNIVNNDKISPRKLPNIWNYYQANIYLDFAINAFGMTTSDSVDTKINKLKTYLASNPITIYYELETPITTTIEPLTIPFAYENGHIILESGSEEQSLLPTLEYSTVVNKTGQVESVAKTIQRQEKQLTMLEKMLIQNIINLDYNNTLLTLKNEMEEML